MCSCGWLLKWSLHARPVRVIGDLYYVPLALLYDKTMNFISVVLCPKMCLFANCNKQCVFSLCSVTWVVCVITGLFLLVGKTDDNLERHFQVSLPSNFGIHKWYNTWPIALYVETNSIHSWLLLKSKVLQWSVDYIIEQILIALSLYAYSNNNLYAVRSTTSVTFWFAWSYYLVWWTLMETRGLLLYHLVQLRFLVCGTLIICREIPITREQSFMEILSFTM